MSRLPKLPLRWRVCHCGLHYYGQLKTCERCRTKDYRVRRELRLLHEECGLERKSASA